MTLSRHTVCRLWCMRMANCPKLRIEVVLSGLLVDEMFSKADGFGRCVHKLEVRNADYSLVCIVSHQNVDTDRMFV